VIPLQAQTEYVKSHVPIQGKVTLSVKDINCDLAMSATFYKAQGRNMPYIIGCLSKNPCHLLRLSYSAVFVWLSRTNTAATCKALPPLPGETFEHLSCLRVSENLVAYMNGLNSNGTWDVAKARLARDQYRLAEGCGLAASAVRGNVITPPASILTPSASTAIPVPTSTSLSSADSTTKPTEVLNFVLYFYRHYYLVIK
jgi:hypothetical protein